MTQAQHGHVVEVVVSGAEIFKIVQEVSPILEKHPDAHVAMAALTIAAMIMFPGLNPNELQAAVKGMSEWMAHYTDSIIHSETLGGTTPEVMN